MRGMMMVWLEGSLAFLPECLPRWILSSTRPEGSQRTSGKPPVRPQAHTPTPLARRLPEGGAGGRAESPLLASIRDNSAVSNSPWRGLTRRLRRGRRACSPMGRSIVRVANRRGLGASGKPPSAPAGANPRPRRGMTRRLRRGGRACSPMGRSHFSFGGERKVCKRKPAARRLREKGFYCPF